MAPLNITDKASSKHQRDPDSGSWYEEDLDQTLQKIRHEKELNPKKSVAQLRSMHLSVLF
jgi:hypothetical protein